METTLLSLAFRIISGNARGEVSGVNACASNAYLSASTACALVSVAEYQEDSVFGRRHQDR